MDSGPRSSPASMPRSVRWTFGALLIGVLACGGAGGVAPSGNTGQASPSIVAVGQPMKADDGRLVTVVSFKRSYSTGNQFEAPSQGHEFVLVVYKLVNGSGHEWSLPTAELSVLDANGQKYDETPWGDNVSSLVAGGHADAVKVIYEVPTGIALDVVWQPDIFSGTVYQTTL